MRFILGFSSAMFLLGLAALVFALRWDIGANKPPTDVETKVFSFFRERAITRLTPKNATMPDRSDLAVAAGLEHYRANCLSCHGAPGIEAHEMARGLHPPAPDLAGNTVQSRSDGELFWIISHGIRMTGMPAFNVSHSGSEIWHIVAFLRRLPRLTDEEKDELRQAEKMHHHRHESDADHTHEESAP